MKIIWSIAISFLVLAIGLFFGFPVWNYGFYGVPVVLLLSLSAGYGFMAVLQKDKGKLSWPMVVVSGSLLLYMTIFAFVVSTPVWNASVYRQLVGNVVDGREFSQQIAPISIEKIRVVDYELAALLGDKVLGSQPALGSQVVLGQFNIQKVNNELYWVAPLLHSGFFKWLQNGSGTPGYVMVSATNERDVRLVQQASSGEVRIKYQPNGFLGDYLHRHIYFSGVLTDGLDDFTFEIDDDGVPYWVVTLYRPKVGFGGKDAIGIVTVHAQTGEVARYGIEEAPDWVDRIQPESFVYEQLNNWGDYVHGFFNFSNLDRLQTTEGLLLVYGDDNRSYWYTGMTSVGSDESTVGFVLVDTRTKESVFYKQSGATEYAAQKSAMGKVQEKRYMASQPIPYNINGIPSYIMTLKDAGGLVKMYAMVAIQDYTIVGVGNSLRETLISFKNAFNMSGGRIDPASQSIRESIRDVVVRFSPDVKNGNSYYYFLLNSMPGKLFVGTSQVSNELPLTGAGDSVQVSFDDLTQELIDVTTFDNLSVSK